MGPDTIKAVGVNVCVSDYAPADCKAPGGTLDVFFFSEHSTHTWSLKHDNLPGACALHLTSTTVDMHTCCTHILKLSSSLLQLLTGKNEPWAEFTSLKSKVSCLCLNFRAMTVIYFSFFFFKWDVRSGIRMNLKDNYNYWPLVCGCQQKFGLELTSSVSIHREKMKDRPLLQLRVRGQWAASQGLLWEKASWR